MAIHKEIAFDEEICEHLGSRGGIPVGERCLFSAFPAHMEQR
jgi:hypothetical protein